MTFLKSALAGTAAAGLLLSQAAPAATVSGSRTGANIEQSEELGLPAASTPMFALLAVFLAIGVVLLVEGGDDDETPVSP